MSRHLPLWPLALAALVPAPSGCGGSDESAGSSGGGGPPGPTQIEPFPLPAAQHEHGDPSGPEQQMLELIQRARANPAAEGELLANLPEAQTAIAQYGVDTAKLVADFASYEPAPPLAFDPQLAEAARFHSDDMATNGFQGHEGTAGDKLADRIKQAGYVYSRVGENVFARAKSVTHCQAAFLIDWGNEDLGHRLLTLDLENRMRHVGLSIIENPSNSNVGPLVVTQDFGMPMDDSLRYLVGVVYADLNGNGAYDPAEGLPDAYIVPDQGGFYAVTSWSGGYAIPFSPGLGELRVQLQSAPGKAVQQKTATIADENVNLDFLLE
ncbi:MAG: CAP domain-containing protein [Deltaproteobacteria bacterium]|nr:CAP domain-containing protein [Deltaproteobacteria bacterium]